MIIRFPRPRTRAIKVLELTSAGLIEHTGRQVIKKPGRKPKVRKGQNCYDNY